MRNPLPLILTFAAIAGACSKSESTTPPPSAQPVEPAPGAPEPPPAAQALEAPPQAAEAPSPAPASPASAPEASAQAPMPSSGGPCTFVDPQFFGMLPAKWEGPCQDGKAHGRGILRSYDGKKVAATFFGSMEQGNPKLGVVEDRDGLLIGRFAPGGTAIESDDFKDRLDGVNEAVAAAKEASNAFQKAGNTASAALYAKKAKMLDKQIE
jgi:hypothetical protein